MKKRDVSKRLEQGRTLLELMISITIGLAVLVAILAMYSATSSTSKQSDAGTRMSEDAAVAMGYMSASIRMAGFSFPQANVPAGTALFGSSTVEVIDRNFAGAGIRGCDTGFSNPTAATTALLTCNAGTGSSAIAVRFQGDVRNTSPSAGNPTDCLNNGVTLTVSSDYDAAISYALVESRFMVRTGTSSGTSELYCAGNGASGSPAYTAQPLMQYVDQMVLSYGIAEDVTSQRVVRYVSAADIDLLGGTMDQNWARVISVKICLVMRSEQRDQNGPGSYAGCAGTLVSSTDGFLRRAFTSAVTLRNRGGISL